MPLGYPSFNTHKEFVIFPVLLLHLLFTVNCLQLSILEPPEEGLSIEHDEVNNTISCYSNGLFPKPDLTICVLDT